MATIRWKGDQFVKRLEVSLAKRMDLAAEQLKAQVQRALKRTSTRSAGPSAPGEIPHAFSGKLSNNIVWERRGPTKRIVGASVKYGAWLELGTSRMAARPFLRPSLQSTEFREKMKRIMRL